VLAHARRQHRWARGDWQILWWLFPIVPTRSGFERNRLPLISRWKILDNLRRTQVPLATVVLLLMGWTVLPGSPLVWTLGVLAALAFPVYPLLLGALARLLTGLRMIGVDENEAWRVTVKTGLDSMPAARRQTLEYLLRVKNAANTSEIATALGSQLVVLTKRIECIVGRVVQSNSVHRRSSNQAWEAVPTVPLSSLCIARSFGM